MDPSSEHADAPHTEEVAGANNLEAPNYLPPLQCTQRPWNCSCIRECTCAEDGVIPPNKLQKPISRYLMEEEEGLPPAFKCGCRLTECECYTNGTCEAPHKGDYMLNFMGGYLEVEDVAPFVFNGQAPFTIEAWVRVSAGMDNPSRVRCIIDRFNYGVSGQFRVWMQDYKIQAQRETKDNAKHRVTSAPLPPNQWVHFAVVYTGATLVLLINGRVVSMRGGEEVYDDARSTLLIGACKSENTYVRGFTGVIDDVRIWNEARPQTEIQKYMFERIDPTSVGLVGYWMCNLGTGRVVGDSSRSKRHAKIGGTVKWEPSHVPVHERLNDVNKFLPEQSSASCGLPNLSLNPPGDMARGASTTQTSTGWGGLSDRAIDGVKDGNYGAQHCTHTEHDYEPWWRLDFGTTRPVGKVKVLNRADCCWDRLRGFEVYVGDEKNDWRSNKLCGTRNHNVGSGSETSVTCNPPITGRFVFIVIRERNEYLTLCSVEIFAPEDEGGYITFQEAKCGPPQIFYKSIRMYSDPGGAVETKNALLGGQSSTGTCTIENAPLHAGHSNHFLCPGGTTTHFGQYYLIKFYEPVGGVDWTFKTRIDAGYGMGVFFDGGVIMDEQRNLYQEMDIKVAKVSAGVHALEIASGEGCCDGERGGWQVIRGSDSPKPLTTAVLMGHCIANLPNPEYVTYYAGRDCTGATLTMPTLMPLNLCEHKYSDGQGMNDNLRSVRAPAGSTIMALEHCGPSAVKDTLRFVGGECINLSFGGPSFIQFGPPACKKQGWDTCSLRQLKNAETMGYYDMRWGATAEGLEAVVTGKCSGTCEYDTVPYRDGGNVMSSYCCQNPEFVKYIAGPTTANDAPTKCSNLGGMWSPCSYSQLKRAEKLGMRKCQWGRFARKSWDVSVCGDCGSYSDRPGECELDTLRTTPRVSNNVGVYCCHLGCS
eukprot:c14932_g1_i1.p1 GENE.c14932_g1_i1~~c14932_g1_i1.p1  ORF type:complete len:964 (+),score=88.19 c14932_g1_i1:107-2893(+)